MKKAWFTPLIVRLITYSPTSPETLTRSGAEKLATIRARLVSPVSCTSAVPKEPTRNYTNPSFFCNRNSAP